MNVFETKWLKNVEGQVSITFKYFLNIFELFLSSYNFLINLILDTVSKSQEVAKNL